MTDTYPLFSTPAAQAGDIDPSWLFQKQIGILLGAGVSWERLNPDLRAAYLLGYYLGNVRNGGHSQFMGNARNLYGGDPVRFLDWAMTAAERYAMPETLAVMRNVQIWMAQNPSEAATQTGFDPHVSPALEPLNRALYAADLLDEQVWLARVNSLPKAYARAFLHMRSYAEGFVRFPAIFSDIEEVRFLTTFTPVEIIPDDDFETHIAAVAAADPIAKAARLAAHKRDLEDDLPKPATCAALSLFAQGAHLPATQCLRAGAARTATPDRSAVMATADGKRAFVLELGKSGVRVFEASGNPDAAFDQTSHPAGMRGIFERLARKYDPRRRGERALDRIRHGLEVRKTRKIGEVPNAVGDDIAALNRRFHLAEALALWKEKSGVDGAFSRWRLAQAQPDYLDWLFETAGKRVSVTASAIEVRVWTDEETWTFPHADLVALRQQGEGAA